MRKLTHLSLFTGIGGLDLAAEWAGFETVGQCEFADFPTRVLEKHWPAVPRWRDIRTLTKENFYERTGLRTIDAISGGFPCQPFSTAGLRRGKDDDRYLWPEMLRVVEALRPTWVVGENVAGIGNMALDDILTDLEAINYSARALMVPAAGVGAPHRRDRFAILANSHRCGDCGAIEKKSDASPTRTDNFLKWQWYQGGGSAIFGTGWRPGGDQWAIEPSVGRVADGVPNRMDRLKCLGNAVVPQVFFPIFSAIAEIEKGGDAD